MPGHITNFFRYNMLYFKIKQINLQLKTTYHVHKEPYLAFPHPQYCNMLLLPQK